MALVLGENDNDVCQSWEDIEENSDILEKQLERLKLQKVKQNEMDGEISELKDGIESGGPMEVTLDSTTEESLRTQYAPPEPKMTILMRPKQNKNNTHSHKSYPQNNIKTSGQQTKTLQQREQEYAAARMRILGDVRFEAEEAEAEMEAALSPAEILKLKIAEAIRADGPSTTTTTTNNSNSTTPPSTTTTSNTNSINSKKQNKKAHNNKHNKSQSLNPPDVSSTESSDGGAGGAGGQQQQAQQNGAPEAGTGTAGGKANRRNKRSREKLKTVNPEPTRDFPVHKTDSDRIIRHPRGPDGSSGFTAHRTS